MKQNLRRILAIMMAALVMILAVCLTGPRSRITSSADADLVVSDGSDDPGSGTSQDTKEPEESEQKEEEKPKEEKRGQKTAVSTKRPTVKRTTARSSGGSRSGTGTGKNGSGSGTGSGSSSSEVSETISVKLDPNGGSCSEKSINVVTGGKYGSIPAATRDGYTFAGWYTAAEDGTEITAETTVTQTAAHTIYAHWNKVNTQTYTITFDPNGGRIKNKEKTRSIQPGDRLSSLPLPVMTGQEFIGWYTAPDGGTLYTEDSIYDIESDLTLYANWNYDPYKYWSQTLTTIRESMYACQVVDCYIEFEDNITASSCAFLSDCKAGNAARNRGDNIIVDDEWVEGRNPAIIIKCVDSMSNASAAKAQMESRFPGRRVIVAPMEAVYGDNYEQLYFTLCLGKAVYPSWFEGIDLQKASEELEVSGNLYE